MDRVLLALAPAVAASVWAFGWMALAQCAVALAAGIVFDGLCRTARERRLTFSGDRSVAVTSVLVGIGIPPSAPLWIVVVALGVAVVLAKELYGGLGRNVFNPAMAGYAAVLVAYPQELAYLHAESGATALDALRFRDAQTVEELMQGHAAFGALGASGFEWVNAAALLGGLYLLCVRVLHWRIPVALLLGIAVPATIFYDSGSSASLGSPLLHWFSGATMLAAFFIATDPVTAPRRAGHQWLFAFSIGVLIFVIRVGGSYPDGVAFAVLLGNVATPILDRWSTGRA